MVRSQLSALALSAAILLGATACSAAAPDAAAPTAEAPSVAPAADELITGTGYSFSVPDGRGDPGPIDGFDPDALAADLDDADGFADNVNVVLSPAGRVTPEQVESAGVKELEDAGATDVTVQSRVNVAGARARTSPPGSAAGAPTIQSSSTTCPAMIRPTS